MFKNYMITLEIKHARNTNDNHPDYMETIKREYWDCDFYIINNVLTIYKNKTRHSYDLTEVDDVTFKQLHLDDKHNGKRWEM